MDLDFTISKVISLRKRQYKVSAHGTKHEHVSKVLYLTATNHVPATENIIGEILLLYAMCHTTLKNKLSAFFVYYLFACYLITAWPTTRFV